MRKMVEVSARSKVELRDSSDRIVENSKNDE